MKKIIKFASAFLLILLNVPVCAASSPFWMSETEIDGGSTVGFSSLSVDLAGNTYVLWVDESALTSPSLILNQHDVETNIWSAGQIIITGTVTPYSLPALTVDNIGLLHAAWVDTRNVAYDLYYINHPASGGTWSTPEKINEGIGQVWSPALTADAEGNIFAIWRDSRDIAGNPENATYVYASKRPVGGSWGPNVRINTSDMPEDRASPAVALHNGTLHIAWADFREGNSDIYYDAIATTDPVWDSGDVWSGANNQRVNPDDEGIDQVDPAITVDAFGNVYVAWADARNITANDKNWDVYVSVLPVGKEVWTDSIPQRLNDDATTQPQGLPTLAADGYGTIWAAWMDGRDRLAEPYQWSIYTAKLGPGAAAWSVNHRASDNVASSSREWPVLAMTPGGDVQLVWRDFRDNATPHLYATTAKASPLLRSSKVVNLTTIEAGDTLTYTLALRNSSATLVTATLTDTLPAYTNYITGSAQASDGTPVTVADGLVTWSGQVLSSTPTLIEFAVEAQTAPPGIVITSVAHLNDGQGNVLVLGASSTYNVGYRLTINDGALYTRVPTVTLRYGWDAGDAITAVRFSNDGGFGSAGNTTDWLPVNATNPIYENWMLDTYGDLVVQRTVFVKFRNGNGQQYGPFQDGIIYDPNPTQVLGVEILTQTVQSQRLNAESAEVTVRVTSSDDNSGVHEAQLSQDESFVDFDTYPVIGEITDISWTLSNSDSVYVRVVDRAGNVSAVATTQTTQTLQIPLTPVLLSPPHGIITTTRAINLAWQAGSDSVPDGYSVKLNSEIITTTATTSATNLALGIHSWTVRAYNAAGYSEWATPWTVEVTKTLPPPATPILLSPTDGLITTDHSIMLAWKAGAGATPNGYHVESDDGVITTTATTSVTTLSLGVHTWRVRAYNTAGTSEWTPWWTVEVTDTLPPPITPTLLLPANGLLTTTQTLAFQWQAGKGQPQPDTMWS